MIKATATFKVGEGNEPDVFLGPIQNEMQYNRVKGFFEDVKKQNYKVVAGGENPTGPGYFITPTIVDRPREDSRLVLEEPFGMFFIYPLSLPGAQETLSSAQTLPRDAPFHT